MLRKLGQQGFTAFEVIVVLLLLGILSVAVYIAYINSPYKPVAHPAVNSKTGAADPVCQIQNADIGCGLKSFNVTTPVGGQQICLGSTVDVKWTAPSDMDTVTITLREDGLGGSESQLGIFPASQHTYSWDVDGVKPSSVYKIWLNSRYKVHSVNADSSGLFTIKNCDSPSPSPQN